jgi:hypothetical protein
LEGVEGSIEGAASGIDAPLELAEGLGVLHAGLAEGKIVFLGEGFLVGIFKELGFGGGEAAEGPLAADEVVEQEAGFGGGGLMALVVLGGKLLEVGGVLGGNRGQDSEMFESTECEEPTGGLAREGACGASGGGMGGVCGLGCFRKMPRSSGPIAPGDVSGVSREGSATGLFPSRA